VVGHVTSNLESGKFNLKKSSLALQDSWSKEIKSLEK